MASQTVYEQLDYNSKCSLHSLKCALDAVYANYVTAGQKTNKNAVITALNEINQISRGIAENACLLVEKLGGTVTAPKPKGKGKNAAPIDESFEAKIRRIVKEEVTKNLKVSVHVWSDGGCNSHLEWGKKEFGNT
jgi:hypothetical protein